MALSRINRIRQDRSCRSIQSGASPQSNSHQKDGKELTRSFERYVLHPGTLDASDNL